MCASDVITDVNDTITGLFEAYVMAANEELCPEWELSVVVLGPGYVTLTARHLPDGKKADLAVARPALRIKEMLVDIAKWCSLGVVYEKYVDEGAELSKILTLIKKGDEEGSCIEDLVTDILAQIPAQASHQAEESA